MATMLNLNHASERVVVASVIKPHAGSRVYAVATLRVTVEGRDTTFVDAAVDCGCLGESPGEFIVNLQVRLSATNPR